ncbi:reduction in Cnn dots 1 [Dermacentor variabilis]|uniref:reduction in Cnn dots 1 n=1 Tax=Dermacentor variabilis TaxID=34621 RepID=UPI003F5B4676
MSDMCAAAHHYHYGDGRASSAEMYLHRLSGQEKEPHIVSVDHSYAKAWNAHPDSHHAKPAKLLFMKDVFFSESKTGIRENVVVNVETWKGVDTPPYDGSKTRNLMSECERSASVSSRPDADATMWDENVKRLGWTSSQHRAFNHVLRLLHADRLARLAYNNNANEPVLRRLAVDRTARRLRRIMGLFSWDLKLLQWLHQLLMEKATVSYVAAYMDALQALRAQIPQLIDKLVARQATPGRSTGPDAVGMLLRRPWDPVAPFLSQHKPKRLPCSPLLVVCPGGPRPQAAGLPRSKFWTSQLSVLGKLVAVDPVPTTPPNASLNQVLEAMVAAARAKVLELKSHFSSRPIILIGWMIGGLVACQVSLMESVAAVVCFGFPLVGLSGSRDVDDPLLDSHTPTLFVVGQNALSCSMDELENFREHMKAVSGLVVVGGADDSLHMCALKKRLEGVTQSMVDRCVLDEVGSFLQWVLSAPHMGPAGSMASKVTAATATSLAARRCSQAPLPESSCQVALGRRQGRQYRSHFHHQSSSGSSNMDSVICSSSKSSFVATGMHTKRGSGRRVGRPPKQVTEKPTFSSFAPLKVPRPLAGQQRKRTLVAPTTWPAGSPSQPSLQSEHRILPGPPAAPDDTVPLSELVSHSSEVDLMPTSSLWSQSLIADPQSSPCFSSSPMSSPMSKFQQKVHCTGKPLDTPPQLAQCVAGEGELQHTLDACSANSTAEERLKEEGKFVSLADGGVRTSQLQKSLQPLNELQAVCSTQAANSPFCQMVLPASRAISMVVTPTKMELHSGHSGICSLSGLPLGHTASKEILQPLQCVRSRESSALEMLAEASSTHRDSDSSVCSTSQMPPTKTLGTSHAVKGMPSRYKASFSLPSTAATRTRKVRMPRFYDS